MEAISKLNHSDFPAVIVPTISAFYTLLEKKAEDIRAVPKKTFSYDSDERQQLDVYYPQSAPADGKKAPVLIWVYGGGFVSGNRNYPAPFELGWANLGEYFTSKGFITVIPDYRLAPEVNYPKPAEDVRDAALWVINNPESLSNPSAGVYPDLDEVYLMGHSAGGVHVITSLILDTPKSAELRSKLAGWISCAAMYRAKGFHEGDMMHKACHAYYGSEEKAKANDPVQLLTDAPDSVVKSLPRLVMFLGEHEPDLLKEIHADFDKLIRSRVDSSKLGDVIVGKGHNHLSYNWALGSGDGEQWAEDIISWIKSGRKD